MHLAEIQQIEDEDSKHYFPDYEQGPLYLSNAMAGEAGEVCNWVKKFERGDFDKVELRERLMGELADVLIYLVMLAEEMEISLQAAYDTKKEFNEQRYRRT